MNIRNIRRKLAVFLTAASVTVSSAVSFAYPDIEDHWARNQIKSLQDYGIVNGYSDGTFKPDNYITRAEASKIVAQGVMCSKNPAFEYLYSDVNESDWFADSVMSLYHANAINGYGDGTFRPEAQITRAEFSKMVAKIIDMSLGSKYEVFTDTENHWAMTEIGRLAKKGMVNGYPDGSFRPDNPITRAEASYIAYKAIKHINLKKLIDYGVV